MGGRARQCEAKLGGQSGRPWEAKVGGQSGGQSGRLKWEAILPDWLRQIT